MGAAKLNKAQRGELHLRLPVGLVRISEERVVLHPDAQVQSAIRQVFATFAHLGSAHKVLRSLRDDGLLLPRQVGSSWAEQVRWERPSFAAIYAILKNPAYAGAYAYGKLHRKELAAKDPRMPLLVQITGIGFLTAITILAAIGEIERFPSAKKLVGYAGLGSRVHDSGMAYSTGRITKAGRRDLRRAMVDASNHAITNHAHWKAQFEALSSHIGKKKAIVAIARKLLVVVWHVLTKESADRFANPTQVACSMFAFAHKVRVKNLPKGQTALGFTRNQLDRLRIGQEVKKLPWGTKTFTLPESKLTAR